MTYVDVVGSVVVCLCVCVSVRRVGLSDAVDISCVRLVLIRHPMLGFQEHILCLENSTGLEPASVCMLIDVLILCFRFVLHSFIY